MIRTIYKIHYADHSNNNIINNAHNSNPSETRPQSGPPTTVLADTDFRRLPTDTKWLLVRSDYYYFELRFHATFTLSLSISNGRSLGSQALFLTYHVNTCKNTKDFTILTSCQLQTLPNVK